MRTLTLFLFFISIAISAQTDWQRWEAAVPDYLLKDPYQTTYNYDSSSVTLEVLSTIRNGYAFFISDLDGDNCPFYPSCSNFFVLSVKETNFFQGLLMFADRFTRDTNIFRDVNQYGRYTGKLFDPVPLYSLDEKKLHNVYRTIHSHN